MKKTNFWIGLQLVLIIFMQGCASVSVEDQNENISAYSKRPAAIIIRDFNVPLDDLKVDRTGPKLVQFQQKTSATMTQALVREIGMFYPVQTSHPGEPLPAGNYWVLDGSLLRVNQGSRALRVFIGLGAGGTKMETAVDVTDTSLVPARSILRFDTTGGSGATPGILENPTPVGAVADTAVGSNDGITDDTNRTARMIAARLSSVLGDMGWIRKDQVVQYKELSSGNDIVE